MYRSETGLTLLEVILSVAILSIVSLTFINLFGSNYAISVQSGRTSQASALAQEKMEVLRANSFADLVQMGSELDSEANSCPMIAGSSIPVSIKDYDELQYYYGICCHELEFDGYTVKGLRLEVGILQGEERVVVRITTFVPEGL